MGVSLRLGEGRRLAERVYDLAPCLDNARVRKQGEHPMPAPDEYRKIAEEYYRLAREAKTEADRLALLDLAETWQQLASRQDEMTPEQIAEAQTLAREWKPKPER